MNDDSDTSNPSGAHVVVVGNEKGGAGKSTVSIHLVVALLKAGRHVACIDLDTRQRSLTRFFENRASYARSAGWPLESPDFRAITRGARADARAAEAEEFASFADAIAAVEHDFEFVVIDTPASDSHLMRLAHSLADTLVSPLNESFIDIDVFSRVHHDRKQRGVLGNYGELVLEARRKRAMVDNGIIDWVMVRNRGAALASNNARQVATAMERLGAELGFRVVEGLHDRVVYRELFPIGLTALDPIETAAAGGALTASQRTARVEIDALVEALALPQRGPQITHARARQLWRERVARQSAPPVDSSRARS